MLPSLNVTSKETDVNKQFASIRSYLLTLKDEIENELSSISYNQLDADLRKRIDNMDTLVAQAKEQSDIVAQTVKANFLSADEIAARYASIGYVQGNYASFNYLSSYYITASQIDANYASINYLQTNYLTANQISASYITASAVASSYATIGNLNAATARISNLEAGGLSVMGSGAYRFNVSSTGVTISGNTCHIYYSGGGGAYPIWGITDNGTIVHA